MDPKFSEGVDMPTLSGPAYHPERMLAGSDPSGHGELPTIGAPHGVPGSSDAFAMEDVTASAKGLSADRAGPPHYHGFLD